MVVSYVKYLNEIGVEYLKEAGLGPQESKLPGAVVRVTSIGANR